MATVNVKQSQVNRDVRTYEISGGKISPFRFSLRFKRRDGYKGDWMDGHRRMTQSLREEILEKAGLTASSILDIVLDNNMIRDISFSPNSLILRKTWKYSWREIEPGILDVFRALGFRIAE